MVARLIEGWESSTVAADYVGKWTVVSGASAAISGTAGRFGNGLRFPSTSGHYVQKTLDNQATWVLGFALRIGNIHSSAVDLCTFLDGAVTHCGLGITADTGLLYAWRNSTATSLGTSSFSPSPNTWYYVEVKVTINDTTGVFVVRVNGAVVLNLTSADTRNAGNASANAVRVGHASTAQSTTDLDDIYICDATGSVNNDFLGDCKVEQVLPTGAGATTAWTPSAGSNFQCVDDVPPNGDTDYVASSTAGQTDTYAFGDLSVATSGTVKAVQATVSARKDDAGSRALAVVARPGSTDRVGATQTVGDSYAMYPQVWDTNPDTSAAWSVSAVNSTEFGVRLIA